jgi:hypothetical protein
MFRTLIGEATIEDSNSPTGAYSSEIPFLEVEDLRPSEGVLAESYDFSY